MIREFLLAQPQPSVMHLEQHNHSIYINHDADIVLLYSP